MLNLGGLKEKKIEKWKLNKKKIRKAKKKKYLLCGYEKKKQKQKGREIGIKYVYLHGRNSNHIWFTWDSLCDGIEHHKPLGGVQ